MSEKYNRFASIEVTVFTVSGSGVMAIGYITSVFFTHLGFKIELPTSRDIVDKYRYRYFTISMINTVPDHPFYQIGKEEKLISGKTEEE